MRRFTIVFAIFFRYLLQSLLVRLSPVYIFCWALLMIAAQPLHAQQYNVRGTVLDSSKTYPMPSVSVLATNGNGAISDEKGRYTIVAGAKDSIWFSYLGKPTRRFPVSSIPDLTQFDIALQINLTVLPEVKIRPRNYTLDSLQNREDYAKIFNFHKPNFNSLTTSGGGTSGVDINELIRVFQFKKNNSNLRFQQRLLQQEQEKYIDHRFNKALVRRLTNLDSTALDQFMLLYRPSFDFAANANEYSFQLYIKESAAEYRKRKSAM